MNDPTAIPNSEFWLRTLRRGVPEVLVGIEEAVVLGDEALDRVMQVPLAEVLEAAQFERPALVVLVATADHLARTQVLSQLGAEVGVPTVVLSPEAATAAELNRVSAPNPPELVSLPAPEGEGIGLASIRRQLRNQLGDDLAPLRRQDAELCLTELAANAARHAGGEPRVTMGWAMGRLRVSVHDHQPAWPSPGIPDVSGGRGLRLIHALAGVWGVMGEPQGKVVWFEMDVLPT